jgi:hypothetical protein
MKLLKSIKKMCTPAQLYLGLSVLSILSMCYQNIGTPDMYTCGLISAKTPFNNTLYLLMQGLYIVGWTYLLSILCKKGYDKLSWVLVLLPIIAMFVLIGLIIISLQKLQ